MQHSEAEERTTRRARCWSGHRIDCSWAPTRLDPFQIVLIRAYLYGRGACADFTLKSAAPPRQIRPSRRGHPAIACHPEERHCFRARKPAFP